MPKIAMIRAGSIIFCQTLMMDIMATETLETDDVFRFNGNVRNNGLISNLPLDSCVEVPIYVDKLGLHPACIGNLPPQCAALCLSNIISQGLAVKAVLTGNFEYVVQVITIDPLTSTVLTLKEARDMTIEIFQAEKDWLPQFDEKKVRKVSIIEIPEGTKGVNVPLDPALAIAHRFSDLEKKMFGKS